MTSKKPKRSTSRRSGPTYEKAWLFQVGRDPILVAVFSDPFRVVPASDKNFPSRGSATPAAEAGSSEKYVKTWGRGGLAEADAARASAEEKPPAGGRGRARKTRGSDRR